MTFLLPRDLHQTLRGLPPLTSRAHDPGQMTSTEADVNAGLAVTSGDLLVTPGQLVLGGTLVLGRLDALGLQVLAGEVIAGADVVLSTVEVNTVSCVKEMMQRLNVTLREETTSYN